MAANQRRSSRQRAPAGPAVPPADSRAFYVAMLLITVACLAVHVASAQPRLSWMWGAHFYAFFPPLVMYAATIAAAACVVLLDPRRKLVATLVDRTSNTLTNRNLAITAALLMVAGAALFWVFRICHTYLGDGNVIVMEIDTKQEILPREPLTSVLQFFVYETAKPWFAGAGRNIQDVAHDAVAVGSVAAGIAFLTVLWFVAGEIARLRTPPPGGENRRLLVVLLWLCLAGQGYMQLFFGYVENYSFYAVGMALFLWLSLRCLRGASGILLPALALCLCLVLHLASAVLGVAFLALVVVTARDPARRRGAIRDLAIIAGVGVAIASWLAVRGHNPVPTLFGMANTAFNDPRNRGYMFSNHHLRDFLNEQMLIGPLAIFLFVAALVTLRSARAANRGATLFLALAGVAFAFTSWMMGDSNLGYARDWDLMSHAGIVFTVAGLGLFLLQRTRLRMLVSCLGIAWVVSVYHTVPWVATNANEARSLARLHTLPLGKGRTEVLLAGWYERRSDNESAREWVERSIAAYPGNPNSHYKLGVLEMNEHRYDRALAAFEDAVRVRPDKIEYRVMAVNVSFLAGQPGSAIPHLETMRQREPGNMSVLVFLGEALLRTGRADEARSNFAQARAGCAQILASQPSSGVVLTTYGWALFRLGDAGESLNVLNRAVRVDPQRQDAHCYLGSVLRSLGRDPEARRHFLRCRELGTELSSLIPDREAIIASLDAP